MIFVPSPELIVHETQHWRISHRVDCPVPGYLMVGAKDSAAVELSDVTPAGLSEVGHLLAWATAILQDCLGAERVYVSRYGHDSGHTVYFHVIPIYPWLLAAYRSFPTYFDREPSPDGADLTRFLWREYCEIKPPPPCPGYSVAEAMEIIRQEFNRRAEQNAGGNAAPPRTSA